MYSPELLKPDAPQTSTPPFRLKLSVPACVSTPRADGSFRGLGAQHVPLGRLAEAPTQRQGFHVRPSFSYSPPRPAGVGPWTKGLPVYFPSLPNGVPNPHVKEPFFLRNTAFPLVPRSEQYQGTALELPFGLITPLRFPPPQGLKTTFPPLTKSARRPFPGKALQFPYPGKDNTAFSPGSALFR